MLVFIDRGLSFFSIGLLIACRDLTVNLLEIPSGAIADSCGRRGAMIVSFVAYIASFVVLGGSSNLFWLFAGMFLYGVGDTFRTGTHKAMIFQWLRLNDRADERTKIYGLTRSWSQIGSAVSGLIAAGFILISGSYEYVFYFAIIPYALNLVNFAGYPAELDGEHDRSVSMAATLERLKRTLGRALTQPRLRHLVVESMGWGGFFAATKDYLQPVLQSAAIGGIVFFLEQEMAGKSTATGWLNEPRTTALLIGPVYASLFLMSAWASRNSHCLVDWLGSEMTASKQLWLGSGAVFVVVGVSGGLGWIAVLIPALVCLHVLNNVWRPILVSRFDLLASADEGATVMSIESQAQRAATFLLAPSVGWAIDQVRIRDWGGEYWPIGLIGAAIAIGMYFWRPATELQSVTGADC